MEWHCAVNTGWEDGSPTYFSGSPFCFLVPTTHAPKDLKKVSFHLQLLEMAFEDLEMPGQHLPAPDAPEQVCGCM